MLGQKLLLADHAGGNFARFPRRRAVALPMMGGVGQLAVADARGAVTTFRFVAVAPIGLTVIFRALLLYYRASTGMARAWGRWRRRSGISGKVLL